MASRVVSQAIYSRDYLLLDPRVNPAARRRFMRLLSCVRQQGLPLMVWEVVRTRRQQRALYAQGRTNEQLLRAGYGLEEIARYRAEGNTSILPIATHWRSPRLHATGRAMDCCWLIDGNPSRNGPDEWWQVYGRVAKELFLTWGGDWKAKEDWHVQWEHA